MVQEKDILQDSAFHVFMVVFFKFLNECLA